MRLKSQNLFVTGTDTGVGKTLVTALLALRLQTRGANVGVMKPFASGCEIVGGKLQSDDARWLKESVGVADELEVINPTRWLEPLAPLVAARRAADRSDYWAKALEAYQVLASRHECLIVEGVGGLLAPMAERDGQILTNADWASTLALPVVLVARRGLGTINHTLLTVEALRARNIAVTGLVFCDAESLEETDVASQTSPPLIAEITGLPLCGNVPHLCDLSRANLERAAQKFLTWPNALLD